MNIKLLSALDNRDGYGYIGESIALALIELGHNVSIEPIKIWYDHGSLREETKKLVNKSLPKVDFELVIFYPVHSFNKIHDKAAICTMFEANRCPDEWVKKINRLGIPVFAPSAFVEGMFQNSGIKVPVHIWPLGIDTEFYAPKLREYPENIPFRFLTLGKLEPRKNVVYAVQVFEEVFSNGENVEFIIKTRERFLPQSIKETAKKDSRIKIIEKTISEEELRKLYYYADVFVYPSRSEGFGFPPRNAVATGLPTLVTDWSALAEIPGTIKVPIKGLGPMPTCGFSYGQENELLMANIDEMALSHLMSKMYYDKRFYKDAADFAYDAKQLTWEESANLLVELMEKI